MPTVEWCLVMALWGEKYSSRHVNEVTRETLRLSAGCVSVVLVTDRFRDGIDPQVQQKLFPAFFDRPDFFLGGYVVKLSMFDRSVLPADCRCVYVDLDTLVIGDLGKVAALIRDRNDVAMLPPGNLISFGVIRRLIWRVSRGRRFAVGNSSIVAYHSGASPNTAEVFREMYLRGDGALVHMRIDDLFISRANQAHLRAVPRNLVAMFRREFLFRSPLLFWLAQKSGITGRRRARLVAVTMNGEECKPAALARLAEGAVIRDARGRIGYWSEASLGPVKAGIERLAARLQ
jgi:hypothetical protein